GRSLVHQLEHRLAHVGAAVLQHIQGDDRGRRRVGPPESSPMPMMPRMAAAEVIQSALFMVASAYRVLSCSSRDSGSFMRPRMIGGIMEYTRARIITQPPQIG